MRAARHFGTLALAALTHFRAASSRGRSLVLARCGEKIHLPAHHLALCCACRSASARPGETATRATSPSRQRAVGGGYRESMRLCSIRHDGALTAGQRVVHGQAAESSHLAKPLHVETSSWAGRCWRRRRAGSAWRVQMFGADIFRNIAIPCRLWCVLLSVLVRLSLTDSQGPSVCLEWATVLVCWHRTPVIQFRHADPRTTASMCLEDSRLHVMCWICGVLCA